MITLRVCSDVRWSGTGEPVRRVDTQSVFFLGTSCRKPGSAMTCDAWEWFMGRYEDELRGPYGFYEIHPVWKMWWFHASVVVLCLGITWFFWTA
ncbi:MAG: hypothetical protein WC586_04285 [Methanoregula sp.]